MIVESRRVEDISYLKTRDKFPYIPLKGKISISPQDILEQLAAKEVSENINGFLNSKHMSPTHRLAIKLMHGIGTKDEKVYTQQEVGEAIGMDNEGVRELYSNAVSSLRRVVDTYKPNRLTQDHPDVEAFEQTGYLPNEYVQRVMDPQDNSVKLDAKARSNLVRLMPTYPIDTQLKIITRVYERDRLIGSTEHQESSPLFRKVLSRREEEVLFGILDKYRDKTQETNRVGDIRPVKKLKDNLLPSQKATYDCIHNYLIEKNMPLIYSAIRKRLGPIPADDVDDIANDCVPMLMKAVNTFEIDRGNKFSTYGTWAANTALHQSYKTRSRFGREFTVLDDPAGDGMETGAPPSKKDSLIDDAQPSEDFVMDKEFLVQMRKYLNSNKFTHRQRLVVKLRYGIGHPKGETHTLKEVGGILGVTKERVRQIQNNDAEPKLEQLMNNPEEVTPVITENQDVYLTLGYGLLPQGEDLPAYKALTQIPEEVLKQRIEESTTQVTREWLRTNYKTITQENSP